MEDDSPHVATESDWDDDDDDDESLFGSPPSSQQWMCDGDDLSSMDVPPETPQRVPAVHRPSTQSLFGSSADTLSTDSCTR